jgi:membrane associated rhomboid family serine protease
MPAFPVTAGICVIAAFVFLFAGSAGADLLVLDARAFDGEVWRVLTTVFVHAGQFGEDSAYAGLMHAGFNIYWCLHLAPPLEERWGHLRLVLFIVAAATISSLAEYAFLHTAVGLSGVVYAFVGARWILQKNDPAFEPRLEDRLWRFFVFWFFFCIALTLSDMLPVANIAHGVGALMGLAMGALVSATARVRIATGLGLLVSLSVYPLASPSLRPSINLAPEQGVEYLVRAERAFSEPDYKKAEAYLLACTAYPRCPAMGHYNLGVARERLGDFSGALAAFEHAAKLEPGNLTYSSAAKKLAGR